MPGGPGTGSQAEDHKETCTEGLPIGSFRRDFTAMGDLADGSCRVNALLNGKKPVGGFQIIFSSIVGAEFDYQMVYRCRVHGKSGRIVSGLIRAALLLRDSFFLRFWCGECLHF